jgi:hypothetical protein
MMIERIPDNYKTGEFKIEDWEKFGLINDKLAGEQKSQVAEILDEICLKIAKNDYKREILNYALPASVKIYITIVNSYHKNLSDKNLNLDLEIYNLINTLELLEEFLEFWPQTLEELKRFKHIDAEANFIKIFAQNFSNKILEPLNNKTNIQILEIIRDKKLEKIIRTKD